MVLPENQLQKYNLLQNYTFSHMFSQIGTNTNRHYNQKCRDLSNWGGPSFKSVFLMVLCPVQSLLCINDFIKVVQGINELYIRMKWLQEGRSPGVKMCTVPCLWLGVRTNKCFSVITILFLSVPASGYSSQSEPNTSSVRGQWHTSARTPSFYIL